MIKSFYVAHSHTWLYDQLVDAAVLDEGLATMVASRDEADIIIYLKSPLPDPKARDSLRDFTKREIFRTYVYSELDEPFPWAPGMYASLPSRQASNAFTGGFYVPQHHRDQGGLSDHLEAARSIEPDLLWSFMGTMSNHSVRQSIGGLDDSRGLIRDTQAWSDEIRWGWKSRFREEGRAAFKRYASTLGRSAFVVCPRGRGPSSIRIFESLQVGRAPVIISDEWLPPLFADWDSCSVRIPENQIANLPAILREREEEAETLGLHARMTWEQYFSPERQLETLVAACLSIAETSPNRLAVLIRASTSLGPAHRGLRRVKKSISDGVGGLTHRKSPGRETTKP
jgi:hypothetical protein